MPAGSPKAMADELSDQAWAETAGYVRPGRGGMKVVKFTPKAPPPLAWNPKEMVEELLLDITQGKCQPIKMVVIYYEQAAHGGLIPCRWRAGGMGYDEELALLVYTQHKVLREWREGG